MMKNIILDCDLMKYKNSGLYNYCLNLGNYVKKILDRDECEKMMYYVPPSEKRAFASETDCIVEKTWHSRYFKPFLWNCDIWHAPFQYGRIVQRYHSKMKIVLTIHDMNILHEDKPQKEKTESLQRTQKLIDASDAIICISEHCKRDVLENLNTNDKPLRVIHNGIPEMAKAPDHPDGYHPEAPFVFTLGYVSRQKNLHSLLALLKQPDLELIIAGRLDDQEYVESIKKEAESLRVGERLKILGPISEMDKAWYYENASAFAFPSLAEGFSTPVLEAMAYGKPIFLSDRTSLPEIGGSAAFYFSNFEPDHMFNVFRQGMSTYVKENLAPEILQRGREFNWENKAMEYVNVYRALY